MMHDCIAKFGRDDIAQYGEAISRCYQRDDGSLWVENGEYESRVNFCPFCGSASVGQLINYTKVKEVESLEDLFIFQDIMAAEGKGPDDL